MIDPASAIWRGLIGVGFRWCLFLCAEAVLIQSRRSPQPDCMYLWIACILASLAAALAWLLWIETPRLALLLAEIRRQQHAHLTEGGDDAAAAAAHAESLQFDVRPLTLTLTYRTVDGKEVTETGTAEVQSIIEPDDGIDRSNRPLFLIIPGNPSLVGFYRLFMLYLHRLTRGAVEFRAVSFVGHTSRPLNAGRTFAFNFQLEFMKAVTRLAIEGREDGPAPASSPEHARSRSVFLAGHSVGAYACLQILDALSASDAERIKQVFMLFPTISDIAATPNGRTHTPALRFLRPVALGIVGVVSLLPRAVQGFILSRAVGMHPYEVEAAHGLLHVSTAGCALRMARDEMAQIGALQIDLVRAHLPKLYWIWGVKDQWAPMHQLQKLKGLFGMRMRYELAHKDAVHAFVVGGSHLVAPVVAEQLRAYL